MSIEAFYIITLDNVILLIIRPVLWLMERLKLFDYQNCPLKERQLHYTSLGGEGWRSDREGHYRHKEY